mgnify:CR=1 FL=1
MNYVYEGTMQNLLHMNFPQVDARSLLLREELSENNPDPSDKEIRRSAVRDMGLEIVLLVGDNLGDFYTDIYTGTERDKTVRELRNEFGNMFIVLPNAMYGNWPEAIGVDGSQDAIIAKLQEMCKIME